jgi:hypothetical protein
MDVRLGDIFWGVARSGDYSLISWANKPREYQTSACDEPNGNCTGQVHRFNCSSQALSAVIWTRIWYAALFHEMLFERGISASIYTFLFHTFSICTNGKTTPRTCFPDFEALSRQRVKMITLLYTKMAGTTIVEAVIATKIVALILTPKYWRGSR